MGRLGVYSIGGQLWGSGDNVKDGIMDTGFGGQLQGTGGWNGVDTGRGRWARVMGGQYNLRLISGAQDSYFLTAQKQSYCTQLPPLQ